MGSSTALRMFAAALAVAALAFAFKKRVGIIVADLRKARSPTVESAAPAAERLRFFSALGAVVLFALIGITAAIGVPVKVVYAMLMLLAGLVLSYLAASAWSGFATGRSAGMRNRSVTRDQHGHSQTDKQG